ncbi:MAG: recombinase family protein [Planctomycetia bacterium]|nr:recombinase family protein [Planctomycetia bacterium]
MERKVPAAGYLRKSTSGVASNGRERQEKSISQQRTEIESLAQENGYKIVRWYADPGKSGWKRGAARPEFSQMLADAASKKDIEAIVVDNMDRFSRASVAEVQGDALALKQAGVLVIVSAAQGTFHLGGAGNDIGEIIKFVVSVWSANDFCRQLSRRVSLSRRNRAMEGKRSGGIAPYGMENDGCGGIRPGNASDVAIVRRIFDEFGNRFRSMNAIASDLNREKTPGRRGGKWHVASIKELLSRRAYVGDFQYNRRKSGQFFILDSKGDIVDASNRPSDSPPWKETDNGTISHLNHYEALVDRELFERVQSRFASFMMKGSRRPRDGGYPLSGVLICDHCGKPMYGCQPTGRPHRVYRCSTPAKTGVGTCGTYEIREERILPTVLKLLGEEIRELERFYVQPPDELVFASDRRKASKAAAEQTRVQLLARIGRAEESLLDCSDRRTRQSLDGRITTMRDELEALEASVASLPQPSAFNRAEFEALSAWWSDFIKRALRMPVSHCLPEVVATFQVEPGDELPPELLVEPRVVNEVLHSLGAEVRLRWHTETVTMRNGKTRNRHRLHRGRMRLGRKKSVTFYRARPAGPSSCSACGHRCGSRMGKGSAPRRA